MNSLKSGSGSVVIPAARVKIADESVLIGRPRAKDGKGEPKVQLVREDGVIRAIDVTCTCGSCVRIKCEYN